MIVPALTKTKSHTAEIKRLDSLISAQNKVLQELKQELKSNPTALTLAPWDLLARKIRLLSAQSWSGAVESWVINHHGWEKVPASLARGDARCGRTYIEIKATLITATYQTANFVQIRPHHKINEYHLFVIEPDHTLVHLVLTAAQMKKELTKYGRLAHGTKAQNTAGNAQAEFAIRIPWTESSAKRSHFIKNYRVGPSTGTHCC
jgi:hypothetical protein